MILRLPTSATRELFDSSLRSMKDSPDNYNIILEVDNIATIKDLVRKNLGVSVLPQSACLKELRKGSLTALPIENLSMVRETRLVYNRDFRRKDILRDHYTGVPGDGAGRISRADMGNHTSSGGGRLLARPKAGQEASDVHTPEGT